MCEANNGLCVSLTERKTVAGREASWLAKSSFEGSLPLLSLVLGSSHLSLLIASNQKGAANLQECGRPFLAGRPLPGTPQMLYSWLPALVWTALGVGGEDDHNRVSTNSVAVLAAVLY